MLTGKKVGKNVVRRDLPVAMYHPVCNKGTYINKTIQRCTVIETGGKYLMIKKNTAKQVSSTQHFQRVTCSHSTPSRGLRIQKKCGEVALPKATEFCFQTRIFRRLILSKYLCLHLLQEKILSSVKLTLAKLLIST